MAEVNTLEEKLAEVLGLAQAAQGATKKIEALVDDDEIKERLREMRQEAEETERRCTEAARTAARRASASWSPGQCRSRRPLADRDRGAGPDAPLRGRGGPTTVPGGRLRTLARAGRPQALLDEPSGALNRCAPLDRVSCRR
ncbi:MAG TPA: hypothetical protein VK326_00245 [Solirubrobacterales bacterium]|nr:hypothetical protein [Solirubrobacterales bacterium]